MNPFLFSPQPKSANQGRSKNDEQLAQETGNLVVQMTPWHPLSLRLGKLLIKMGTKLAGEEARAYAPRHTVS